jgi:hypothetical protein
MTEEKLKMFDTIEICGHSGFYGCLKITQSVNYQKYLIRYILLQHVKTGQKIKDTPIKNAHAMLLQVWNEKFTLNGLRNKITSDINNLELPRKNCKSILNDIDCWLEQIRCFEISSAWLEERHSKNIMDRYILLKAMVLERRTEIMKQKEKKKELLAAVAETEKKRIAAEQALKEAQKKAKDIVKSKVTTAQMQAALTRLKESEENQKEMLALTEAITADENNSAEIDVKIVEAETARVAAEEAKAKVDDAKAKAKEELDRAVVVLKTRLCGESVRYQSGYLEWKMKCEIHGWPKAKLMLLDPPFAAAFLQDSILTMREVLNKTVVVGGTVVAFLDVDKQYAQWIDIFAGDNIWCVTGLNCCHRHRR